MARQIMTPMGFVIDEDGEDEYMLPVGFVMNEDQGAAAPEADPEFLGGAVNLTSTYHDRRSVIGY